MRRTPLFSVRHLIEILHRVHNLHFLVWGYSNLYRLVLQGLGHAQKTFSNSIASLTMAPLRRAIANEFLMHPAYVFFFGSLFLSTSIAWASGYRRDVLKTNEEGKPDRKKIIVVAITYLPFLVLHQYGNHPAPLLIHYHYLSPKVFTPFFCTRRSNHPLRNQTGKHRRTQPH